MIVGHDVWCTLLRACMGVCLTCSDTVCVGCVCVCVCVWAFTLMYACSAFVKVSISRQTNTMKLGLCDSGRREVVQGGVQDADGRVGGILYHTSEMIPCPDG